MASKPAKRILLTRADNEPLASSLKKLGAEVLEIPLIKVELDADAETADDVLSNIACYEWIAFSSANGVRGFFKEFFKKFKDIRCIGPCRIACVGKATAKALEEFHIQTDVIPEISSGAEMAKAMLAYETLENLNILCVGGNLGDGDAAKILEERGRAIVDTFCVYKTSAESVNPRGKAARDFSENGADAIFFASPSAVESFLKNAKALELKEGATRPKAYSIGPKTSEALKKFGITVAKEAQSPEIVLEMFEEEFF